MDDVHAEFLGFLVVAVVGPVTASLWFTRRWCGRLKAGVATAILIVLLSTALGGLYGLALRLLKQEPQMDWSEMWAVGAYFGVAAGPLIGLMRAAHRDRDA